MRSTRFFLSQKNRRVLCGWIVVAALAFHGLIPLGYMPDSGRHAGQPVAMVICGGMGPMAMPDRDDAARKQPDKDQKKQDHAPCPFSVNALFAFGGIGPGIAAPIYALIVLCLFAAFVLAPSRQFGNASPRAPPFFS